MPEPKYLTRESLGKSLGIYPAPVETLCRYCDPTSLGFQTTDELPDLQAVIGQPRAFKALELGCEVSGPGYNIFVFGFPGSGRTTLSLEYLKRRASQEFTPDDWCYVNNFAQPHSPHALRFPAGEGQKFHAAIQELIEITERELPRALESDEFNHARESLLNELKRNQETEFLRLQEHVEKFKFTIVRTPFGMLLSPTIEGKPISIHDIENLTDDQRKKFEELQQKLGEDVEKTLKRLGEIAKQTAVQIEELTRQTALYLISPLIQHIQYQFETNQAAQAHLNAIQADMVANAPRLRSSSPPDAPPTSEFNWQERYAVNVFVDNSGSTGAPVILEGQPGYHNLIGRIEHTVIMGATRTDFSLIRAGSLHRANGGYLLISAHDLLISPYAWEGLKRVLRDGCIRIIELGNQLGLISTETLDPEPIPLDIKIILIGTPTLYFLLRQYDDDFAKLFKVRAEFTSLMDRKPETENEYGLFVKSVVVDNELPPFDASAVARIIEFSSRLAEDQSKLSTRFGKITDLIREAAYWSKKNEDLAAPVNLVTASAVQKAIDESIYRQDLWEERIQELFVQEIFLIDTSGQAIGRVNALSVIQLGDYAFGRPSRVSAAAFPGRAGIIDIERQAKLSGPIHTKGILILSGFLGNRYGRFGPVNLTASLTFEQSYDEVEGDSASAAELVSLLSAITEIPLRQDLAITGSINQHGQIQAIGGVNEKIEGFFKICQKRGLTGEQGVIIPAANLRHLMLNLDVVQAVAERRFHIWPIQTIDQALELLTNCLPGELETENTYPEASFNRVVVDKLAEYSRISAEQPENHPPAQAEE